MNKLPVICHETEDFAVVFKPPRMHTAPIGRPAPPGQDAPPGQNGNGNNGETLLDWYAKIFPPVMELSGKKENEGGLLHRLDFETQGLVLFAKNRQTLENLLNQQKQGKLIKEYSAICWKSEPQTDAAQFDVSATPPLVIQSYFRPYGPGRKQVRPVMKEKLKGKEIAKDGDDYYKTEVIGIEKNQTESMKEQYHFTVRLKRGFRHQIRCHLAWIGFPVLNDPLYGKGEVNGFLALKATGLFFDDPKSNKPFQFSVEQ
jgi:23S rRNA pseudouridine1911/1915/1917 synthase